MASCDILNKNTGEPIKFYQADNGEITTSLSKALENSTDNYKIGFKNEHEEFVPRATISIHPQNTIKGKIQSLIKTQYLRPVQIAPNTYEAQDSIAAEMVEQELIIEHPFGFTRKGNVFIFESIEKDPKTFEGRNRLYGEEIAHTMGAIDHYYRKTFGTSKPKATTYTKEELYQAITSFMEKLGIRQESIKNYKENYKTVKGLDPDAKVFIDINNKIIATTTGTATIEDLSEETAHFIIEAWNQDEIKRLLDYIPSTKEYLEHQEIYRKLYGAQHSDPKVVEEYVRKEVLGKMLAKTFERGFKIENRTDIETNLFNKLGQILRDFILYIKSKITPVDINEIEVFTNEINNLLFNEELSQKLATHDPKSLVPIMYNVGDGKEVKSLIKEINGTNEILNEASDIDLSIKEGIEVLNNRLLFTNVMIDNLEKFKRSEDKNMGQDIRNGIHNILIERDDLEMLRSAILNKLSSVNNPSTNVQKIHKIVTDTGRRLSDKIGVLNGEFKTISKIEVNDAIDEYADEFGIKDYMRNLIKALVKPEEIHQDAGWFTRLFAHVGKTSNAIVSVMHDIVSRMNHETVAQLFDDMKRLFTSEIRKNPSVVNSFVDKGIINSEIDFEKKIKSERTWEYNLRKQIDDKEIENISLDEFLEKYDSFNQMTPDLKGDLFYKYDRLFKAEYNKQEFVGEPNEYWQTFSDNMDAINASSNFYKKIIELSRKRNAIRNSVEDAANSQIQTIERRRLSNIFDSSGEVHKGLKLKRFGELKEGEEYAQFNPRKEKLEDSDFVVVALKNEQGKYEWEQEGEIAYYMLKWNAQIHKSLKSNGSALRDNFKKAYEAKKAELRSKGLTDRIFQKQLKQWMDENVQFEMIQEYWDSLNTNPIDPKNFGLSNSNTELVDTYLQQIGRYKLEKTNILRIYKMVGDSREIVPSNISENDKHRLSVIEDSISEEYSKIINIFKTEQKDVNVLFNSDLGINSISQFNKSFYEDFQELNKMRYEDAPFNIKENFFKSNSNVMSSQKLTKYENFKKAIEKGINYTFYKDTIDQYVKDLNIRNPREIEDENQRRNSREMLYEQFLKDNAQTWYKRFDANEDYNNFVRELENETVNVEELIDNYISSSSDNVIYRGRPIHMMQMSPSLKYNVPIKRKLSEIYEEDYLDPNKTDLEKWNILMNDMGEANKVSQKYRINRDDIKNNPEKLKIFIQAMNWHLDILHKNGMLKPRFLFQQIQMPKTELERAKLMLSGDNKIGVLKDSLLRMYQFRPDEMQDAYRNNMVIPKMGFVKLNEDEISNDWLASLAWGSYHANLYQKRSQYFDIAQKQIHAFENLDFEGGKNPTDTNYYHVLKEMMDYNFFGKTVTHKARVKILGKEIDMAKVLIWFRKFTISQALAFSPIVATTNYTSGLTQHQILKIVGKKIYRKADDRADKIVYGMIGDSIKDIGAYDPQSKLNKIMYSFGVYDIEKRFENAQFNKVGRLIPHASFGAMAVTNFMMQSKIVISKLMEIRLIDGDFYSWNEYYNEQSSKRPGVTEKELKSEFDKYADKSMYDYLDEEGQLDEDKIKEDGYSPNRNLTKTKAAIMGQMREVMEQVTMEMHKSSEGSAARNPFASFILSLKKWVVIAHSTMFMKEGTLNIQAGGQELGLVYTAPLFAKIFKEAYKDQKSFIESYRNLKPHEQQATRQAMVTSAVLTAMLALAIVMKGWGDDDDEENPSYLKQFAVYMMLRNLNETSSGTIGIGDTYYNALQNPIMTVNSLGNMAKLANFSNMGKTVESGKYEGMNKWLADLHKATFLKNMYTLKDANTIRITRSGYTYFNQQQSLYSIFDLLPDAPKKDEK